MMMQVGRESITPKKFFPGLSPVYCNKLHLYGEKKKKKPVWNSSYITHYAVLGTFDPHLYEGTSRCSSIRVSSLKTQLENICENIHILIVTLKNTVSFSIHDVNV